MLGKSNKETGPTPFEIGLHGSIETFYQANKQAVEHLTKRESHDKYSEFIMYLGAKDQRELRRGAVQAFHEGRPENIQTALLYGAEFGIHDSYVSLYPKYPEDARQNILSDLINGGNDPSDVINLVLLLNVADDERQAVLDRALLSIIRKSLPGGEPYIAALLNVGADPNAGEDGYKGMTLAASLNYNQPLSVIDMLYKNGASFDDAIESMKINNWSSQSINRMKILREKYTHQPATIDLPPEVVQQLLEQAANPDEHKIPREIMQELLEQVALFTERQTDPLLTETLRARTCALSRPRPSARSRRSAAGKTCYQE